jgi:hypothetical protein
VAQFVGDGKALPRRRLAGIYDYYGENVVVYEQACYVVEGSGANRQTFRATNTFQRDRRFAEAEAL